VLTSIESVPNISRSYKGGIENNGKNSNWSVKHGKGPKEHLQPPKNDSRVPFVPKNIILVQRSKVYYH